MHVVAENYEQIYTHTHTRDNHSNDNIRSAEAYMYNINYTYAKPLIILSTHYKSGIIIKCNAVRVSKHVTEGIQNIARRVRVGIN